MNELNEIHWMNQFLICQNQSVTISVVHSLLSILALLCSLRWHLYWVEYLCYVIVENTHSFTFIFSFMVFIFIFPSSEFKVDLLKPYLLCLLPTGIYSLWLYIYIICALCVFLVDFFFILLLSCYNLFMVLFWLLLPFSLLLSFIHKSCDLFRDLVLLFIPCI